MIDFAFLLPWHKAVPFLLRKGLEMSFLSAAEVFTPK